METWKGERGKHESRRPGYALRGLSAGRGVYGRRAKAVQGRLSTSPQHRASYLPILEVVRCQEVAYATWKGSELENGAYLRGCQS